MIIVSLGLQVVWSCIVHAFAHVQVRWRPRVVLYLGPLDVRLFQLRDRRSWHGCRSVRSLNVPGEGLVDPLLRLFQALLSYDSLAQLMHHPGTTRV